MTRSVDKSMVLAKEKAFVSAEELTRGHLIGLCRAYVSAGMQLEADMIIRLDNHFKGDRASAIGSGELAEASKSLASEIRAGGCDVGGAEAARRILELSVRRLLVQGMRLTSIERELGGIVEFNGIGNKLASDAQSIQDMADRLSPHGPIYAIRRGKKAASEEREPDVEIVDCRL